MLQDLRQVSAVSLPWARHAEKGGWPAAHAYLYVEPGSKADLRRRYAASMQRLLVKDWVRRGLAAVGGTVNLQQLQQQQQRQQHPGTFSAAESLVGRIFAFAAA